MQPFLLDGLPGWDINLGHDLRFLPPVFGDLLWPGAGGHAAHGFYIIGGDSIEQVVQAARIWIGIHELLEGNRG